jgi:hypothetical protein
MMTTHRRAALYARVSTGSQATENQLRELHQVAERHGWTVVAEFVDNGISGAKGRDARHGLDELMQAGETRDRGGDGMVSGSAGPLIATIGRVPRRIAR